MPIFFSGENIGEVRVLAALFALSVFRLVPAANRILQALMHMKLNDYTIQKLLPLNTNFKEQKNVNQFNNSIKYKTTTSLYSILA